MPHQTAKDTIADSGSASRFFPQFVWDAELDDVAPFLYQTKPARSERDAGLDSARNIHPTVKSVDLLRWLVRLVTPPKGIVVDPFAGSGSCGIAAMLEGRRYFGIELNDSTEEPFVSIARARIAWVIGGGYDPTKPSGESEATVGPAQRSLF